jgi:hypothetical protein
MTNKKPIRQMTNEPCRGPDQIRTGVGAFAELCLATRPQDPLVCTKILI